MASQDLRKAALLGGFGAVTGGAISGAFGRKKTPKIDFGKLRNILNLGIDRQRAEIDAGFRQTPLLNEKFRKEREALGRTFETGANQRAQDFARGLQGIESPEFVREQQAQATELAFRNLPAAQQAIRENLAATGGLNRGAAIQALQAVN